MTLEEFKSLSPAEFFYRNREIAGFSNPARALYQTVRELVENALDATEVHGILPLVRIYIERDSVPTHYTVSVEDNGIGIPPQYVPQAFGQVLFSSKYRLRQTRGMFGLGAKMAILYGQLTTGKPVEVITSPIGSKRVYSFKLMIDIKTNRPVILEKSSWPKKKDWHGTIVSVSIEGDWSRAKSRILEYVKRVALITPYAEIVFQGPDNTYLYYPRAALKLPKPPKEVLPHPYGIDLEALKMMIASTNEKTLLEFLYKSFQGVGKVIAQRFLQEVGLDLNRDPKSLTIDELKTLVTKLKTFNGFKPPRADPLSPIGAELIAIGLKQILKPEFVVAITRRPSVYEGHPFIVEVGLAYGGQIPSSQEPLLYRYANKIPLLYDEKSDLLWKIVSEFDWHQYSVTFPAPLAILIHVCSTKIPYKGVGKESIADVSEIEREVKNALREAGRKLRLYIQRKRKIEETYKKLTLFIRYIPEIALSLESLSVNPQSRSKGINRDKLIEKLINILNKKMGNVNVSKELINKVVVSIE